MLIRKYKTNSWKNEAIVGCLIEKNDYEKDENSIALSMKWEKRDV